MNLREKLRVRARVRSAAHRIWPPRPKPLILVYHRIAHEPVDYWRVAVSPDHFEEHLTVLRRTRHPLSLDSFVYGLKGGTLPSNAVAITFDDGYADNLIYGKPRLTAAGIPATVFLVNGYIDSNEPFWWDELTRLLLLEYGPQRFELMFPNELFSVDFAGELPANEDGSTPDSLLQTRRSALKSLRQALRSLEERQRSAVMGKLRTIFGGRDLRPILGRAMNASEVRNFTADGLVTIGAHTVRHQLLPVLDPTECAREIVESKVSCEALTGAPVNAFAYPYGEYDPMVINEVKRAGFSFACCTRFGPVASLTDAFALPRISVTNTDGEAFERTLHSASLQG